MAENTYVNQVGLADGTVLIDLTSDTAVATDVQSGKYFHLATGERVQGSSTKDSDTTDANALASEILSGRTAYVNKNKITGEMANQGAVSAVLASVSGVYAIPGGFHNGLGTVQIDPTEQAKIISSNIKSGITILGVEGSYAGSTATAAAVSAVPYLTSQTIQPPSGYDYISEVIISEITIVESDNAAGGRTVTIGQVDPNA